MKKIIFALLLPLAIQRSPAQIYSFSGYVSPLSIVRYDPDALTYLGGTYQTQVDSSNRLAFDNTGRLFGISGSILVELDPTTHEPINQKPIVGGFTTGIAVRNGVIYSLAAGPSSFSLVTFDANTLAQTSGTLEPSSTYFNNDVTFDNTGRLFAISASWIFEFDPTTRQIINQATFFGGKCIAARNGVIYAMSGVSTRSLVTYDANTLVVSAGTISAEGSTGRDDLSFDDQGRLFAMSNDSIDEFDPVTLHILHSGMAPSAAYGIAARSIPGVALPDSGTGDFDGNGKSDVFLTNTVTGERAIWLMNGAGIDVGRSLGKIPLAWSISGRGDFNGNGKTDLLWTNVTTGERAIWLMNGATNIEAMSFGTIPLVWSASGTGDFDGDGKTDIFWTNTATGERAIWVMSGTTITTVSSLGIVPVSWSVSGSGDFDHDGKTDLFWTNTVTGERAIWLMNGTSIRSGAYLGVVPVSWSVNGTGDFDQNGKTDILWRNTDTGECAIWLMDGVSITLGASLGPLSSTWAINGTGDVDGNGKTDVFLTNTTTGQRVVWFINGTVVESSRTISSVPVFWQINR